MQQQPPQSLTLFDPHKYNPELIRHAAQDKFDKNDVEGAQMVYASALLDWVDDAREGAASTTHRQAEEWTEAIATLWLLYAGLNIQAKQFKSAMDAYEGAVTCPVAGSVGRVWLEYARFAQDRNKMRTAQKIFLRALVGEGGADRTGAVTDQQDRTLLWQEFLEMMRRAQSNPSLTMKELREAVEQQQGQSASSMEHTEALPDRTMSSSLLLDDTADDVTERPEKRQRIEGPSKTHVVTAEAIDAEANDFLQPEIMMPPEISAAWYVRDGDAPPAFPDSLFSPSPPKLADPTGRDMLGDELAVALLERLVKNDDQDVSGSVVLEVCRGLWMLTALKEKETSKSIEGLDASMISELETMENNLEARLSVAGAAASAIQQMNENERSSFQQSCFQRRQQLLTSIAWEFRSMLCFQQQALTKLCIPGFEGPSVDTNTVELHTRICSYLHSAFYLRQRIGETPHQTTLKSQLERLRKDVASSVASGPTAHVGSPSPQPSPQQASMALPPPPPMGYQAQPMYTPYPQQMQPQQGYMMQPGMAGYAVGMVAPGQQQQYTMMPAIAPYGQPQQGAYYPPQQQ